MCEIFSSIPACLPICFVCLAPMMYSTRVLVLLYCDCLVDVTVDSGSWLGCANQRSRCAASERIQMRSSTLWRSCTLLRPRTS